MVRQHFMTLSFAGSVPGTGQIVNGEAGSEALGTRVRFELRVERNRIQQARFRAYGCPYTLATCNWLAERLEGAMVAEAPPGGPEDWARTLGIPLERLGRLLVVEDALRAALGAAVIPEMARL